MSISKSTEDALEAMADMREKQKWGDGAAWAMLKCAAEVLKDDEVIFDYEGEQKDAIGIVKVTMAKILVDGEEFIPAGKCIGEAIEAILNDAWMYRDLLD